MQPRFILHPPPQPQFGFQKQQPQFGFQKQQPQFGFQKQQPQFWFQQQQPQFWFQQQQPQFWFQQQQPQFWFQQQQPQFWFQQQQPQFQQQQEQFWKKHLQILEKQWQEQEKERKPITKRVRRPLPICDEVILEDETKDLCDATAAAMLSNKKQTPVNNSNRSVGEMPTSVDLDRFHRAGQEAQETISGEQRVQELLSATPSTMSMKIVTARNNKGKKKKNKNKKKSKQRQQQNPVQDTSLIITIVAPDDTKHSAEELATYAVINMIAASAIKFLYGLIWLRKDIMLMRRLAPEASTKLEAFQVKINSFCDRLGDTNLPEDYSKEFKEMKLMLLHRGGTSDERRARYAQFFSVVATFELLRDASNIGALSATIDRNCSNDIAQKYVPMFLHKCAGCVKDQRKRCVAPTESSLLDKCMFVDILAPAMAKTNCRRAPSEFLTLM
jgi:hypothetical protein